MSAMHEMRRLMRTMPEAFAPKRNPIAKAVTRITPKVVPSKRAYTRKVKHKARDA